MDGTQSVLQSVEIALSSLVGCAAARPAPDAAAMRVWQATAPQYPRSTALLFQEARLWRSPIRPHHPSQQTPIFPKEKRSPLPDLLTGNAHTIQARDRAICSRTLGYDRAVPMKRTMVHMNQMPSANVPLIPALVPLLESLSGHGSGQILMTYVSRSLVILNCNLSKVLAHEDDWVLGAVRLVTADDHVQRLGVRGREIPNAIGLTLPSINSALPPQKVAKIPSRFRPPGAAISETVGRQGHKRVYLGIQFALYNAARPVSRPPLFNSKVHQVPTYHRYIISDPMYPRGIVATSTRQPPGNTCLALFPTRFLHDDRDVWPQHAVPTGAGVDDENDRDGSGDEDDHDGGGAGDGNCDEGGGREGDGDDIM
ncbi:hypothetical protein EDB92DRAFT_1818626 [Lactarius akahatsu]|uniref:Uncharacterized protein n=1 Tax=Lactarius akahatsu TaxID=416441 RepID=A0AAD4LBF8_9AGAM|nr:hypothetical protein EDB92DRAFT_1818626 [Lactarius akahatsu]